MTYISRSDMYDHVGALNLYKFFIAWIWCKFVNIFLHFSF